MTLILVCVGLAVGVTVAVAVTGRSPTPVRAGARGERGAANGGFMKRVVKVCFVVFLVAGAAVYLTDLAERNADSESPSDTRPHKPHDRPGDRH